MSEHDEIAKGLVYAHLVDRVRFVKDADSQLEQRIITALTAAVAAERAKWKAFAGPDGEPRKVLGTLPVTADGFIVGVDAEALWFIDRNAHKDTLTGKYQSQVKATTWSVDRGRFEFVDRDGWEEVCYPSECYSTKEAATSALAAQTKEPPHA
jgi:hypothetical protein